MSHQTGIRLSDNVRKAFVDAQSGVSRLIKIQIRDDELVLTKEVKQVGNWESDFALIGPLLEKDEPCYLLYRNDDNKFLFFSYVPDFASVRGKMIYAATKSSFAKDLGDSLFVDTYYGTVPADFTHDGYKKHVKHQKSEAPLTRKEEELKNIKLAEVGSDISISDRKTHVSGIAFPMSSAGTAALAKLASEANNTIIFIIKDEEFCVKCEKACDTIAEATAYFRNSVAKDEPAFVLFRANASNGTPFVVFVYSCSDESPVRLRMLYSSSRTALLGIVEAHKIQPSKRFEITSEEELTPQFVEAELSVNVVVAAASTGFIKKVAAPGGARRLAKK